MYKTFGTEVLLAEDLNDIMRQTIIRVPDTAARDALTPVEVGMVVYCESDDRFYRYTGVTWVTAIPAVSPFAYAAGSVSISLSSSTSATVNLTFPPGRFTQPPIVVGSTGAGYSVYVSGVTATGCIIGVRHIDASSASTSRSVDWIAMQMTATAAAG